MIQAVSDGNGGKRWLLKKKFTMAFLSLGGAFAIAWNVDSSLGEWTAFCTMVLGLIFAADITDKKLNGGVYEK